MKVKEGSNSLFEKKKIMMKRKETTSRLI